MSGESARIFWLEVGSVLGMILLGIIARSASAVQGPAAELAATYPSAIVVAGFLGLIVSPILTVGLAKARISASLAFVFGWAALITCVWALIFPHDMGLSAAIPAVASVIILGAVAKHRFPDFDFLPNLACPECGYNLSGCRQEGCPECGWRRQNDRQSAR